MMIHMARDDWSKHLPLPLLLRHALEVHKFCWPSPLASRHVVTAWKTGPLRGTFDEFLHSGVCCNGNFWIHLNESKNWTCTSNFYVSLLDFDGARLGLDASKGPSMFSSAQVQMSDIALPHIRRICLWAVWGVNPHTLGYEYATKMGLVTGTGAARCTTLSTKRTRGKRSIVGSSGSPLALTNISLLACNSKCKLAIYVYTHSRLGEHVLREIPV